MDPTILADASQDASTPMPVIIGFVVVGLTLLFAYLFGKKEGD